MSNVERKVYAFIDASNLWDAQKSRGRMLDFEKLVQNLKDRYKTSHVTVYYYTAYPAQETRAYDVSGRHKFYAFLKLGLSFIVRKKELKRILSEESRYGDGYVEKGNMDVELTIDAVHTVDNYDTALLFTGDSDFMALVRFIRARGKKVYVFSSRNSISSELRTGADGYVDLMTLENEVWGREMKFRDQKEG